MSLGRPLKFDPDTALRAALDLFWRKGYETTSHADLLEAMNISKGSMYLAFKSKRELFIKCLLFYQDQLINELSSELEHSSTGFVFFGSGFGHGGRSRARHTHHVQLTRHSAGSGGLFLQRQNDFCRPRQWAHHHVLPP